MRVELTAMERGGTIEVTLMVYLKGSEELVWGMDHCTPHRLVHWSVPRVDLQQWQQLQRDGDIEAALDLCTPSALLWGQPCLELESVQDGVASLSYRNRIPDGLIARAILERLAHSEGLGSLERDLAMLELECGTTFVPVATAIKAAPAGQVAALESLFCIGHADAGAHPTAPALRQSVS